MPTIISIENVSKTFKGNVHAVDDLTLHIEEGEFLTILGPSGCGKTTTLRMLAGFEFPERGRVHLAGVDITDTPPYRRPVNMMFQDFALFPHLDVVQNIGYGLKVSGVGEREVARRVNEALEMIELPDKARMMPSELSNGQKQRVALARALIRRPKVLLLDEPMSALDAKLRETMQVELRHLHDMLGLTFVLVTHDQTEAMVMSDRIVIMDNGRIMQVGSPTELYDRPATPYVASFLGSSNLVVARVREVGPQRIVTEYGHTTLRVASNGTRPSPGSEVMLCIRPEKVRLWGEGAAPPEINILEGTVRSHFFHGDSVRLSIDVGAAEPLLVHQQLSASFERTGVPRAGQTILLAIDPTSVNLFEDVSPNGSETP